MKYSYEPCIGFSPTSKEEAKKNLMEEVKKRKEEHEAFHK